MKRSTIIFSAAFALFINNSRAFATGGFDNSDTAKARNVIADPSGFTIASDPNININEKSIKAGLLYDADNKKIVWQKEMNQPLPIASLTKMMVALLAIEDIHAGKIKWDDVVHWTRESVWKVKGKNKTVYTQASYTVKDLFKAAMIASNNECAEALARYLEGNDLQAVLDRMNLRARELGMKNTWYGNPTGLPGASSKLDNYSTPSDLLLLALEMVKYSDILAVTGMGYADVSNGESVNVIRNHNHLTIDYSGDVDGMKTGYTKRAGFCLVATSKKCDHRLISIALGAKAPGVRNDIVADMINDYYTTIGEDRLTASCNAPVNNTYASKDDDEGGSGVIYQTKTVKTIHRVYKGETLTEIADKYDCSLADLVKWNHLQVATIAPGRKLIVYARVKATGDSLAQTQVADATPPVAKTAPVAKTVRPSISKEKYAVYIVQPGDTLTSIAQNYNGVTVRQIKAINRISKNHGLRVGARLRVPVNT